MSIESKIHDSGKLFLIFGLLVFIISRELFSGFLYSNGEKAVISTDEIKNLSSITSSSSSYPYSGSYSSRLQLIVKQTFNCQKNIYFYNLENSTKN